MQRQCARLFSRTLGPWSSDFLDSLTRTGLASTRIEGALPLHRRFATLPPHTVLTMPSLSPTMSQGNIANWQKKQGDKVKAGEVIADIETDKATLGFEMTEDGILAKILMPAGSRDVKIGTPVAILVEEASDVSAFDKYTVAAGGGAPPPPPPPPSSSSSSPSSSSRPSSSLSTTSTSSSPPIDVSLLKFGPATRFLLATEHVPLSFLRATGPRNLVTREDALRAVESFRMGGASSGAAAAAASTATAATHRTPTSPAAPPPPPTPTPPIPPPPPPSLPFLDPSSPPRGTDIPNSNIRRVIAKRLLESKTSIPHVYFARDILLDGVHELRRVMKQRAEEDTSSVKSSVVPSVNDLVMKAVALALRHDAPAVNATWDEAAGAPRLLNNVDVCVAVATPTGLITPIVKRADTKSLDDIAREVRDLAKRARENKLKPEEFMGGTFSVSNLGMFGVGSFSAIVNPPQGAILAVGGAQERVVMMTKQTNGGGGINIKGGGGKHGLVSVPYMTVQLSCDQRVVDGEAAAAFLEALSRYLENPALLAGL